MLILNAVILHSSPDLFCYVLVISGVSLLAEGHIIVVQTDFLHRLPDFDQAIQSKLQSACEGTAGSAIGVFVARWLGKLLIEIYYMYIEEDAEDAAHNTQLSSV